MVRGKKVTAVIFFAKRYQKALDRVSSARLALPQPELIYNGQEKAPLQCHYEVV